MKSSTPSLSGRRSKTGSDTNMAVCSGDSPFCSAIAATSGFREFLRVLRRWLKEVFTMVLKRLSSQPRSCLVLRRRRMTADLTLGGGLNAPSPTVNRYSMSYQASAGQTVCRTLWSRASRLSSQPPLSVSCTLPAGHVPCGRGF